MTDRSSTSSSDRGPLLTALGLAVALLALDRATQLDPPFEEFGEDLQPFARTTYHIDPAVVPGVSGVARFFRNAQGLRGRIVSGAADDVLLVGGSTVACTLLDEADALGAAIEHAVVQPRRLAALGRGGYPLGRLLPLIDKVLSTPTLRPGAMVLMLGANEVELLMNHLPWTDGPAWDPDGPYGPASWATTFAGWYRANGDGRFLVRPRQAYATGPKRDQLTPPQRQVVETAAAEFTAQLTAVVRTAVDRGTRVVLVTQPIACDATTGAASTGWAPFFHAEPGQGVLPTPRLMHELVERFNAATRAVAAGEGATLVDLAHTLSSCGPCFYDQWHFTVLGASRGGAAIAAALDE